MNATAEIVEAASAEQLDAVRTLFQAYQSEIPEKYRFLDTEWRNLPGVYAPPGGALLLATIAGEAAGCVALHPFPLPGACEMKRLYVVPGFRGHKLGSALIERILQKARSLGYTVMRLDTYLPTMGAAMELYRQFGFVEVNASPMPRVPGLSYMELRL